MSELRDILQTYVSYGSVPGAVGLIARGDRVEVQAAGSADAEGTSPMARDSIFRIASITKPVTAAAVMMLVEEGRIALEDPVGPWLPELASPAVVRTPAGPVEAVGRKASTVHRRARLSAGSRNQPRISPADPSGRHSGRVCSCWPRDTHGTPRGATV